MRAILIDPFKKKVEAVNIEAGTYDVIGKHIFPNSTEEERKQYICAVERYPLGMGHIGYIDETGMWKDWDYQAFFRLANGQVIAGRMLILYDKPQPGGSTDIGASPLPVLAVLPLVTWVEPKDVRVPATTLTTIDKDGKAHIEYLDDVAEWAYDHQPTAKKQ